MRIQIIKSIYIQILIVILFLGGCSPTAKQKVLNVFFDGVPDPEAVADKDSKKQAEKQAQDRAEVGKEPQSEKKIPEEKRLVVHPPYGERSCDSCHESKFSQKLVEDEVKDLCFYCHDDFLAEAKAPHFPAAEGMCLDCHNPHQAENKFLLIKGVQALCFDCHDQEEIEEIHGGPAEESCTECHNPHGE